MSSNPKHAKLEAKNELIRAAANLTPKEYVVQDYRCTYGKQRGKIYVTPNYVVFHRAGAPEVVEKIALHSVTAVEGSRVGLSPSLALITAPATFAFHAFVSGHRDEAFEVVRYLWKHPVSFVSTRSNDDDDDDEYLSGGGGGGGGAPFAGGFVARNPQPAVGRSAGDLQQQQQREGHGDLPITASRTQHTHEYQTQQQQVQAQRNLVDTGASKRALQKALEAREMGGDTLIELSYQAEQIDRIDNGLNNINATLDDTARHLRGIESLPGALANKLSKQRNDRRSKLFGGRVDHVIEVRREKPKDVFIDILYKFANDSLAESRLKLSEKWFLAVSKEEDDVLTEPKKSRWTYDQISEVVVRTRPLHLDVRFKDATPRFRLMTSYIQLVVTELVLRAKHNDATANVVFEKNAVEFEYGTPEVRSQVSSVPVPRAEFGNDLFSTKKQASSIDHLLSEGASKELRQDLKQQDDDLDQIEDVLVDLKGLAIATGEEVDRQNAQLREVMVKTDQTGARLDKQNDRVQTLLYK